MPVKVFGPSIVDIISIEKSNHVESILMGSLFDDVTEDGQRGSALCPKD